MGTLSRPHCKTMKAFTFAMFLTLAVALAATSENAEIDDALLSHLDTTDTEDVSVDLEDDVDASDQSSGYSSPLYTGSCCKHNARWNDQFTLMCKTCAYDTIVAGKSTKKYSWSSGGKVKYEITCAKSGSAGVSCAGKNNDNGGRPRYSATCTCKPKPKADADPSGFKCNKKKRFVPGAGYSQWSSYTNKGGEAGRALCRAHFKNGASAPNGWWYQYYSNGHFNCAKFNSPVTVSESKWENTHGRPEEVCVPSAPAIDVTQHLAAYKAVSAGKMKATKAATKASQCASDETFFWCQNNGKSTDKYDYCGDNHTCPVNGVHSAKCCYCGGCLKAV